MYTRTFKIPIQLPAGASWRIYYRVEGESDPFVYYDEFFDGEIEIELPEAEYEISVRLKRADEDECEWKLVVVWFNDCQENPAILLEDGFYLLMEDGFKILLEN